MASPSIFKLFVQICSWASCRTELPITAIVSTTVNTTIRETTTIIISGGMKDFWAFFLRKCITFGACVGGAGGFTSLEHEGHLAI